MLCSEDDTVNELWDEDWGVLSGEENGLQSCPLFCTNSRALGAASSGLNALPLPVAQSGLLQFFLPHPRVSCVKYFPMSSLSAVLQVRNYPSIMTWKDCHSPFSVEIYTFME